MGLLGSRLTFLFLSVVSLVSASPTHYGWDSTIIHRVTYPVIRDAVDPSGSVMDGVNLGLASDGAGTGFDVPAILWISFGLAVGLYLTLGGMRLWRITTALAIGLVAAFCAWVAIVNTMNSTGVSDLVLTLITLSFLLLGSLGGLFDSSRLAGLTALSILSGMSVGVRIVLLREGLLLHTIALNWIVIIVLAVAGFVVTLFRRQIGIALSCTFTGTFFVALGVDLAVNRQNGVSRGLRHLLDGNKTHLAALGNLPYNSAISTQIILCVSIALALPMAYVQFRFFSDYVEEPTRTRPFSDYVGESTQTRPFSRYFASAYPTESAEKLDMNTLRLPFQNPPGSHFSM